MDLNKIYYDIDGKECTILQLIEQELEWVANRIQNLETQCKNLKESRSNYKHAYNTMYSTYQELKLKADRLEVTIFDLETDIVANNLGA